ncbi:MAG: fibrobacter succinogenes major paralogous domain-containing protein [Bacteroidetes bacterium]|nr:fibrobacter succinogenes major paralogous domain-containing protein [Bacteroidota bacterium]
MANTTYYLKAYAINGAATSYGNEISFVTSKGAPSVVTTVAGSVDPATASAPCGGNVVNDGGAPVTARGVCFSTTPHPTITSALTSDGTGTGSFTSTLTPLLSTQTYYYRAYATNSYGTAYGNELSFTTTSTNTVQDGDGNVYYTVTIGTQTWMTSDLKVTHYQNGDPITNGFSGFAWSTSTTGAYTYPNGVNNNVSTNGLLYSFYAIADTRNIAPKGWHVASDADWLTLEFAEGMTAADTLAASSGSISDLGPRGSIGAKFLNGGSSGLNLTNGGILFPVNGAYYFFGAQGYYATSTIVKGGGSVWYRAFNTVSGNSGPIARNYGNYAMSVRCVKN